MFTEGDKVKLARVNNEHMPLRYDVPLGIEGTVKFVAAKGEWMFVDWGFEDEAAMRMWPEELVLA